MTTIEEYEMLRGRVMRLERDVAALQRAVEVLEVPGRQGVRASAAAPAAPPVQVPLPAPAATALAAPDVTPSPPSQRAAPRWQGEALFRFVGIGLFLFGIAFLFEFAVDQGWLTESIRVGIGLLLATGLFAWGLRLAGRRRAYGQVLMGGSVAAYYISGFAAFQLYGLISHTAAFAYMVLVTGLAYALSLSQRDAVLSILGTVGGLATPFLLYAGSGSVSGLVGYTCLVMASAGLVYAARGWSSLLCSAAVGGWLVLAQCPRLLDSTPPAAWSDRAAVELGIAVAVLVFWVLPLAREVRVRRGSASAERRRVPLHVLSVSTPLLGLALSAGAWTDLGRTTWGGVALALAAVWALAAWWLARWPEARPLAHTQGMVALLLATLSLVLLLTGPVLIVALAAEGAALHWLVRRHEDPVVWAGAHLLWAGLGVALAQRLISGPVEGLPLCSAAALANLAVIGLAAGSAFVVRPRGERLAYLVVVHLALLGWVLRELSRLDQGLGLTSLAWGVYAIGLLMVGMRRDWTQVRQAGLGTALVVVAKLFLVDLAELPTIWRILLFLGFGAAFLMVGYYLPALWKPAAARPEARQ